MAAITRINDFGYQVVDQQRPDGTVNKVLQVHDGFEIAPGQFVTTHIYEFPFTPQAVQKLVADFSGSGIIRPSPQDIINGTKGRQN